MNQTIHWKKIAIHFLVWMSYLILLTLFNSELRSFENSLSRSFVSVCMQVFVFYLNLYLLLPKLLEKKKYLYYAISLVALIFITVWIYDKIMHDMVPDELKSFFEKRDADRRSNMGRHRDFSENFRRGGRPGWIISGRYITSGFFVFISLLISTIYYNTIANKRREQEHIQIKNQMLEAESKMLKWQMNPHFLFNTLNNIYSMSQLKSDKTPDAIHKLSQMLRYVIYECNDHFVKLDKEIEYIQSFINLQLLKEENMKNVTFSLRISKPGLTMAPMLLISFIENGFKHSHIEDTENSWIRIELSTSGSQLNFKMENSIPKAKHGKDKAGGIGIENVEKRLKLLYPDKYYLNLRDENEVYSVELILELNED